MKKSFYSLLFTLLASGSLHAGPVDINTAAADKIAEELNGVGAVKAQAIVDYRTAHGPFKTAEDLTQVKGVGVRTVELNRENILVAPAPKK
jgi:competence protein ComEA